MKTSHLTIESRKRRTSSNTTILITAFDTASHTLGLLQVAVRSHQVRDEQRRGTGKGNAKVKLGIAFPDARALNGRGCHSREDYQRDSREATELCLT